MFSIILLAFSSFLDVSLAAVNCPSNTTPSLGVSDPACWTSVSSSYWQSCTWYNDGIYCYWPRVWDSSRNYYTTGSCLSGSIFHANAKRDSCTGALACDNGYYNISNYGYWVGSTSYNCYYTTVSAWGAPAADGRRVASSVTQHSASGTTSCSSQSNVSYVNAQPNLKINGSETAISVNKYNPITISWSSTYATSCSAPAGGSTVGGWTGAKGISGSEPKDISSAPTPASSSAPNTVLNYQISCTNPGLVNVLDTVPVTVECTEDLNPAWGLCDKQCGTGDQTRVTRYTNCFQNIEHQACNTEPCPVSSEWKEVRP